MKNEFEISLLGELSLFLGLQICQSNQGIFISQTVYQRNDKEVRNERLKTSCKLSKDDDSKSTE
jgi:hypothetical protein